MKTLWQLNILNWGPQKVQWTSDSTLLIERTYWLPDSDFEYIEDYSQLTIRNLVTK